MVRVNKRLGRNVFGSILLFAIISCVTFITPAFCEEITLTQAEQDYAQAETLLRSQKFADAKVLFLSVSQSSDSELAMKGLAGTARCEIQSGNLTAGDALFGKLKTDYSTNPKFYESVYYFAGSYSNAREYDKARDAYQIVYDNSTDRNLTLKALGGLARTNCKKGEYEKVITLCDNVLAGETDSSLSFYAHVLKLKAKCCIDMGAQEQAEAIEQQIDLHAGKEYYPAMQLDIAYSYRQNDKFNNAIAVYNKTIENTADKSEKVEALAGVAASHIMLNDDPNVMASVDLLCKDYAGHEKLGWAVFVIGEEYYLRAQKARKDNNPEQAKEYYHKAIAVWDKNIQMSDESEYKCNGYFFTAVAYRNVGNYAKADEYYSYVVSNFPGSDRARAAYSGMAGVYYKSYKSKVLSREQAISLIGSIYDNVNSKWPDCSSLRIIRLYLNALK